MGEYAIQAEGLGKQYRIARGKRRVMLRQVLSDAVSSGIDTLRAGLGAEPDERPESTRRRFWAIRDISFGIRPGESVGIIGRNGAGKTTLLKILARVTAPTAGQARLLGRVGSLLEVGTGFHSELTGRENIYLNGAVLGMRGREIERKFDEIVDFSGVEEFLETPVKFFSTGMRMRLAFSVAAHLEPEILLVDEVLAVGDAAFQQKCLNKMGDVVGHGRTVLFVSHNMAAVRALCQSALFIDNGKIVYRGDVGGAIERYLNLGDGERSTPLEFEASAGRKAQILSLALVNEAGKVTSSVPHDRPFSVLLKLAVRAPIFKGQIELEILDGDFNTIVMARDVDQVETSVISGAAGTYECRVRFPAPSLVPGRYSVRARAVMRMRSRALLVDEAPSVWPFEVFDNGSVLSRLNQKWGGKFILPTEWEWAPEAETHGQPA